MPATLRDSDEFRSRQFSHPFHAMHASRSAWVRSLPSARHIVDLGGVARDNPLGSLLFMGYPHDFDELVIIDLPSEERHELYVDGQQPVEHQTDRGRIRYQYHSMTDLSAFADRSIDLVVSGQTFEHVTRDEGEQVLAETYRVLRPGGTLALDTPNRAVTALEVRVGPAEFINPDHKVEYHHAEMLELFGRHGFDMTISYGLSHMPATVASGVFDTGELLRHPGLYSDPEACYMLAYLARRP